MTDFEKYEYDPSHAQDYSDPEEFYDEHYEEFSSAADAEEYFYDHHENG